VIFDRFICQFVSKIIQNVADEFSRKFWMGISGFLTPGFVHHYEIEHYQ